MNTLIDITDQRFGKLTVKYRVENSSCGSATWHCTCDCGNEKDVLGKYLRAKLVKSCGCIERNRCHHQTRTPTWNSWNQMRRRCRDPKHIQYKDYGGRGITVCPQWEINFKTFLSDMGKRPTIKHSIDRINTNGNYTPDNCKWSTASEQANNARTNKTITHNGETLTYAQWSRRLGKRPELVSHRITKLGWGKIKAITTPVSG